MSSLAPFTYTSDRRVLSVRIYVIKPSCPFPTSTPSYNRCAIDIVRFAEKESFVEASCCSVLVINGGRASRLRVVDLILDTTKLP